MKLVWCLLFGHQPDRPLYSRSVTTGYPVWAGAFECKRCGGVIVSRARRD